MPVWNAEAFLRAAVESILAQSFRDFELVAVDDGSTDSSLKILQSYNDARIRVVRQEHLGFVEALSRGIAEAKADWIARHDADDMSHSGAFAETMGRGATHGRHPLLLRF